MMSGLGRPVTFRVKACRRLENVFFANKEADSAFVNALAKILIDSNLTHLFPFQSPRTNDHIKAHPGG